MKGIQTHRYKNYQQFIALRNKLLGKGDPNSFRLGASDVATVYRAGEKVGLNEYNSPTVFFRYCCDFYSRPDQPTAEMLRGTIQESIIFKEYWRLFDPEQPSTESMIQNWYGAHKVYRKARKANAIYINEKYPWLAASPDYHMLGPKSGPLEVKCPSSRACEKYEAGIPTMYVVQNHAQQLVLNKNYSEIFALIDATHPKLYQFDVNPGIRQNIIDSTKEFHDLVLKGKKIVYSGMSEFEKEQALSEIAPKDDGSPLYTDYLKDKHKPENAKATIQGDSDQLNKVIAYILQRQRIKEDKTSLQKKENEIREFFRDQNVGRVEWPDIGYIGWIEKLYIPDKILKKATSE